MKIILVKIFATILRKDWNYTSKLQRVDEYTWISNNNNKKINK